MLQTEAKDRATDLYVSNTFTSNRGGQNDVFRLRTPHGLVLLEFRILNRWEAEVYVSTDILRGWDGICKGALQPVGSYVYFIRYKNIEGKRRCRKGCSFVTIIYQEIPFA
ncbi:gliding motility-associated C-terminal domain-containing protein [Chitinophaga sp. RAB17]|uniref:T9SS type B sorting domain-containing protein n=1 Tax=Chitinophaga sp. RAB17 TaxID=3233049 RepID=UPI003F8EC2B4